MTSTLYIKFKHRLWMKIVSSTRHIFIYKYLYKSYWHFLIHNYNKKNNLNNINFYTPGINQGAGIGHQMSNWISAYWFAKKFSLIFAHKSFNDSEWEIFLNFGYNEINVSNLLNNGFKKIKLPLFDENNKNEVLIQKNIIKSYNNYKVCFFSEIDQSTKNIFLLEQDLKNKFFAVNRFVSNKLLYNPNNRNIAVHIRRGDIMKGVSSNKKNHKIRFIDNNYFI